MVVLTTCTQPTEGIRQRQPNTTAYVNDNNLGKGTLYVAESCLSWISDSGSGFSIEYPNISLHAVSRDLSAFPHECLFLMLDIALGDEETNNGDENGDGDGSDDEQTTTELRFVPDDRGMLDAMFHAMNVCQALHPDPEDSVSDDDIYEDVDDDIQMEETDSRMANLQLNTLRPFSLGGNNQSGFQASGTLQGYREGSQGEQKNQKEGEHHMKEDVHTQFQLPQNEHWDTEKTNMKDLNAAAAVDMLNHRLYNFGLGVGLESEGSPPFDSGNLVNAAYSSNKFPPSDRNPSFCSDYQYSQQQVQQLRYSEDSNRLSHFCHSCHSSHSSHSYHSHHYHHLHPLQHLQQLQHLHSDMVQGDRSSHLGNSLHQGKLAVDPQEHSSYMASHFSDAES